MDVYIKRIIIALDEMNSNIKSCFSLNKNILKITSPPYLSSLARQTIISDNDLKDIYNKFEKLNDLIIDYKKRHIDEFNLLFTENEELKDLIKIHRELINEINIKISDFEGLLNIGGVKGAGIAKSFNYKINDFIHHFKELHMNIINKYMYKYKPEGEYYAIQYNNDTTLRKAKIQKRHLNILYYDKNLNNEENSDLCAHISFNINGTFYGCHNFELFEIIIEKIKNSKKDFILICSGSSAKKIFKYCSNVNEINSYYIYCYDKQKYIPLIKEYPKLKGVYNVVKELSFTLYNLASVKQNVIKSSNLIYFEDYNSLYIKLHYEFIVKYALYKKFKKNNITEEAFLQFIEQQYPYYLELALQILPNINEIIEFFYNELDKKTSIEEIREIFYSDDDIKDYIKNYTKESFYYKELNKFLREGDLDAFRTLSSHMSKFIFYLYDYRKKNNNFNKKSDLYRKMYININDLYEYKDSIGRVICYPAFTSTSIEKDAFKPKKYNPEDVLVEITIKQNNSKSVVSIGEFSEFKGEREYLFLPFSFFKIDDVQIKWGDESNPHLIFLTAIKMDKPIEEMFYEFFKNETDKLDPEGLDMLKLCKDNTKIVFNEIYENSNCNIF